VTFGGKWQGTFGAIWPGGLMRDSAAAAEPPSHDTDDERFACCFDDFLSQIAARTGIPKTSLHRYLTLAAATA
jgi:hypothetical protein